MYDSSSHNEYWLFVIDNFGQTYFLKSQENNLRGRKLSGKISNLGATKLCRDRGRYYLASII